MLRETSASPSRHEGGGEFALLNGIPPLPAPAEEEGNVVMHVVADVVRFALHNDLGGGRAGMAAAVVSLEIASRENLSIPKGKVNCSAQARDAKRHTAGVADQSIFT